MVFSSIPAPYQLHDPPNWHQQQLNDQENGLNNNNQGCGQLLPSAPPPHLLGLQPHGEGGAAGFIKPGSMTERARLANIPIPETALPCPRCESTNTKFCYFNNYSLSQPRHFCKTCRRYWTRGGALRNVPVGGGCRRNNKRSKGGGSSRSGSKSSSATTGDQSSGTATITASTSSVTDILGLGAGIPPLRLMAPLQNLTHFTDADSIGLNYGSVSDQAGGGSGDLVFPMGRAATGSSYFSGLDGQWRLTHQHAPQFPFMGGLDSSAGMFSLEGGAGPATTEAEAKMIARSRAAAPTDSVKLEEAQELNLSQQILAMNNDNDNNRPQGNYQHYWNAGTGASAANLWTELSTNFSSSSTGNPV